MASWNRSGRTDVVVGVAGGVLGVVALCVGSFVAFRPNRIVEGDAGSAVMSLGAVGWIALGLWTVLAVAALVPLPQKGRTAAGLARGATATCAFLLVLAKAGSAAAAFAEGEGMAARTSFGWSFYLFLFALYLVLHAAAAATPSRAGRIGIGLLPILGVIVLATFGALSQLGIVREWQLASATFSREFTRHLFYALGATIGAIVIGVPLGVLSARRRRAEAVIMGLLNLGQVLPVLAFIGIMMPILGAISDGVPPIKSLGISGIGWAPVMVVLLIYALYPVTRNTLIAIRQLDPAILDTAKGMGMSRRRTLWEIELPLAFPVVLAGVRIALVQSTAGAIIAAFVGGGGLGTIMFLGLEQTSMDLVLVGVVPIAILALFFDSLLRAVEHVATGGRRIDLQVSTA